MFRKEFQSILIIKVEFLISLVLRQKKKKIIVKKQKFYDFLSNKIDCIKYYRNSTHFYSFSWSLMLFASSFHLFVY